LIESYFHHNPNVCGTIEIYFYPLTQNTMAADPLTPEISDRICKHMNDDHASAVLTYAQVFGKAPTADNAAMKAIDPLGMDLTAQVDGQNVSLRIQFDRELTDSEDAHQVLISMIKEARKLTST
jgi:putative heme iron utilization protein